MYYKTTFWTDFTIAEQFCTDAIKETAQKCFDEWKTNIEYLTELIMVINHKSWYWNEKNDEYMELYSNLYHKYDNLAIKYIHKNMRDKDLNYYFQTLRRANVMKKSVMQQAWEEMQDEYFRLHPDAGVVFWDVPPEQMPMEYKAMIYDIIWNLVHKEK